MGSVSFEAGLHRSDRHRTAWVAYGPKDGPLMIFVHGWPEIGLLWHHQLEHFGARGWRCVAPDMRGYGGSSIPDRVADYAIAEVVADMVELHDGLGGAPAIWIAHDWGAPVAWAMASHYPERCRAIVGLSVPYVSRGFALCNLIPLIDRDIYPEDGYPVGQWDYWLHYRERFHAAAEAFEADVPAVLSVLFQPSREAAIETRAFTADIRAKGGWFADQPLPPANADATVLEQGVFDALVAAFKRTGFSGADAWYLQDEAHLAFARQSLSFGRLNLPVLFLHGARDAVCETARGRLADPMREDCSDLTEATIEAGHMLMLESPKVLNATIDRWLDKRRLAPARN